MITIVDYGMCNLDSVKNIIHRVGGECEISNNREDILSAKKLILPGVGSFDKAMQQLDKLSLTDAIFQQVKHNQIPILGICLGMQLLTNGSEEGCLNGLGLVNGYAKKFVSSGVSKGIKIPHMGWNTVAFEKRSNLFISDLEEWRFYFVHSYAVQCEDLDDVLTTTYHGIKFVSSFEKNNILGVQYHPEKSHRFGMNVIKNFVENY